MESDWIVIKVTLLGRHVELAAAVLAASGAAGTLIEDRQLDTFEVPDDELEPARRYTLKGYFAAAAEPQALVEEIKDALQQLPALGTRQFSVSVPQPVEVEDWAESWKQHFPPLRIGSRLVIYPSWEDYQPHAGEVAVRLDPGMAFGTGTHATTLLCLQLIAELLAASESPLEMLDVGTGSGILALGAAALGCQKIVAIDIDTGACEIARQNAANNGLGDRVAVSAQPLEQLPGQFDLVVANILAEENIRLKQELVKHLRPGGWLVLSGILREKEALVRSGYADLPLESFPTRTQDEWVCLYYRRQGC